MVHDIFLRTEPNGRGTSLFTLPGQMLTSRTALRPSFMTHGCETVRRRFPVGTVFCTRSDRIRMRKGCYFTDLLEPLLLPDGTPATDSIFLQETIREYKNRYSDEDKDQNDA